MALQIRRGTSTNPTLEEGELYLNTNTGVIYTKIGSTVVPINADSSSRSKKLYFNLKNKPEDYDDWTDSSIVHSDSDQFADSTPVVSSLDGGIFNVHFTQALDPDDSIRAAVLKPLVPIFNGAASKILHYSWGFSAEDGLTLTFYDGAAPYDLEEEEVDMLLILDYLEALPT